MKFRFIESDTYEIIAYGKNKNETINLIETICLNDDITIIGYNKNQIKDLNPSLIECFYTEGDKIYALHDNIKYLVKKRLYELNNLLNNNFIYINQGCLVNINFIDHFEVTLGASLIIVLKSGYKDYVSRRMVKNVKERIGIK
jgi:DNA-binding LytR/AlgR family response regulator